MLKKTGVIVLVVAVFVVVIWFTAINKGDVAINLAFGTVSAPVSLTLIVTFVLGWAFGILSMVLTTFKQANERRRLRAALTKAESEVTGLRSLPIDNAD